MNEDKKSGGSGVAIGLGIAALVLAVGGVCCCKQKKMMCFKDDGSNEGGERMMYRKEIKSKNQQKRHAKESLVPTFKVEDA